MHSRKLLFTGAELVNDALNIPLHFALDLTLALSQFVDSPNPNFSAFKIHNDTSIKISLKRMVETFFRSTFVKELAISMSDWSKSDLSLKQIKYACLDAWTSYKLGYFCILNLSNYGVLKTIFSTISFHEEQYQQLHGNLERIMGLAESFNDLKRNEIITVKIKCLSPVLGKSDLISLDSEEYANHLNLQCKESFIHLKHPQGCLEGIKIHIVVVSAKGKRSTFKLVANRIEGEEKWNQYDKQLFHDIISNPFTLIKYWNALNVAFANKPAYMLDSIRRQHIRLKIQYSDEDEAARRIMVSIKEIIRANTIPLHMLPNEVLSITSSQLPSNNMINYSTILEQQNKKHTLSLISNISYDYKNKYSLHPVIQQYLNHNQHGLNTSQVEMFKNAFQDLISIGIGPPGSGLLLILYFHYLYFN